MRDEQLKAILHGLGIDDDTCGALVLLPLVQVAWADGTVQDGERALILDAAADQGIVDEESLRLLHTWLRHRPSDGYLARGRMALVELAHRDREGGARALPPGAIDDIVTLSEEVARAAGGIFLGLGSVDKDEKSVLAELADKLHVDRERNWQQLAAFRRGAEGAAAPTEQVDVHDFDDEDAFGGEEAPELSDLDKLEHDEITQVGGPPPPDPLAEAEGEPAPVQSGPPPVRDLPVDDDDDWLDDLPGPDDDTMVDFGSDYDGAGDDFLDDVTDAASQARGGVVPGGGAPTARVHVHTHGTDADKDQKIVLPGGSATVGRRPDNEIVLRWDHRASRTHCRFFTDGGRWYVVDCGSVNGTLVNGEYVLERRLFGGEQVEVGGSVLRFEVVD